MSHSVLVIDLDGTLIRTDTFHEMLVKGLRSDPFLLFKVGVWLLIYNRPQAKALLGDQVSLDPQTLPYNTDLLGAIQKAKEAGSRIVLATGTHHLLAQKIADSVGLFDEVIASHDDINMTGENKARTLVARYGEKGFIYAGDSRIDAKVWEHAREVWVVNPKWKVEELAERSVGGESYIRLFPRVVSRSKAFLQALNVTRWVVCSLILALLVWLGSQQLVLAIVLFTALCLLSSGASLCTKLMRIEKDRYRLIDLNLDSHAPSSSFPGLTGESSCAFMSRERCNPMGINLSLVLDHPVKPGDDIRVKRGANPFAQGHLHLLTGLLWGPLLIFMGLMLSFLCLSYVMTQGIV